MSTSADRDYLAARSKIVRRRVEASLRRPVDDLQAEPSLDPRAIVRKHPLISVLTVTVASTITTILLFGRRRKRADPIPPPPRKRHRLVRGAIAFASSALLRSLMSSESAPAAPGVAPSTPPDPAAPPSPSSDAGPERMPPHP